MPKPKDFFPLYQPPEDYYSMIGVPPDASRSKIKRAYYKLAKDFHPDRNPDADPHHFAELSKAYAVIFNEQSRTEYDLSQSIKQVLRMGFDCVRYVPQIRVDRESGKKICTGISEESITLFADGSIEKIFYQDAEAETIDGEDDPLAAPPLRPDNENMTESRFIQQVVYGCDDQVLKAFFGDEEPDEEGAKSASIACWQSRESAWHAEICISSWTMLRARKSSSRVFASSAAKRVSYFSRSWPQTRRRASDDGSIDENYVLYSPFTSP